MSKEKVDLFELQCIIDCLKTLAKKKHCGVQGRFSHYNITSFSR